MPAVAGLRGAVYTLPAAPGVDWWFNLAHYTTFPVALAFTSSMPLQSVGLGRPWSYHSTRPHPETREVDQSGSSSFYEL